MQVVTKMEMMPTMTGRRELFNLQVEGSVVNEKRCVDSMRMWNEEIGEKSYKKLEFRGTLMKKLETKELVAERKDIQEYDVIFVFNNKNYDPKWEYDEDECKRVDKKLKNKQVKVMREWYELVEKNKKKKHTNNLEYIVYSHRGGFDSYFYITSEGKTSNLNEPDIRYLFSYKDIAHQSEISYSSLKNELTTTMKRFYKMRNREGETHVEGNYFRIQTKTEEEEQSIKVEFYFKESIQEYYMERMKQLKLENIKIIMKRT